MPKTTKKTKEKKADFTKAKLKLGKGKVAPTNATNTSFKARSIALPAQNPLLRSLKHAEEGEGGGDVETKDHEPLSRRGLTLPEVLISLRHPNAGARRDGLSELKDTLIDGAGPGIGYGRREGEVGRVINGVLRLVPDEDSTVRKGLLVFLGWYLPLIPPTTLPPHLPLLLLQTSSALSHIFPEIRMDACRLVHLLLDLAPSQVVGDWPFSASTSAAHQENPGSSSATSENNILEGLRLAAGIGGRTGEGGQNGLNLLPGSKLVILRTMLAFVRRGLVKQGITISGSAQGGSVALRPDQLKLPDEMFRAYEPDNRVGLPGEQLGRRGVPLEALQSGVADAAYLEGSFLGLAELGLSDEDSGTAWALGSLGGGNDQEQVDIGEVLSNLYLSMYPLLLSSLLEAAPVAFSVSTSAHQQATGTPDVNLALCLAIAEITAVLAGTVFQEFTATARADEVRKAMLTVVSKLSVYFPFGRRNGITGRGPSAETQEKLDSLSLNYANLVILLPPRPFRLGPRQKSSNPRALELHIRAGFDAIPHGTYAKDARLFEEVADWICSALESNKDVLQPALKPQTYASLLPSIWSMITSSVMLEGQESIPERVLEASLANALRSATDSVTRKLANAFIMRMVMIHDQPEPILPFFIPSASAARTSLHQWLGSLPRVLWETATKDPNSSLAILTFLRHLCHGQSSLFPSDIVLNLDAKLVPFFNFEHATRGNIPGPWTRLEHPELRLAALDLALALESAKSGSGEGLRNAVGQAVKDSVEKAYWAERTLRALY